MLLTKVEHVRKAAGQVDELERNVYFKTLATARRLTDLEGQAYIYIAKESEESLVTELGRHAFHFRNKHEGNSNIFFVQC